MRQRGYGLSERMRFSSRHHAVLTEPTHETGCGSKHSCQNWVAGGRPELSLRSLIEGATHHCTLLTAERGSERGAHGRVGPAADRDVEVRSLRGVGRNTDRAAECHAESGALSGTETRTKSLIDGHIEIPIVCGSECRSHPRIDSPRSDSSPGSG